MMKKSNIFLISLKTNKFAWWTIVAPVYGTASPWSTSPPPLVNYFTIVPVLKPPYLPQILHLLVLLPFTLRKEKYIENCFQNLQPSHLPNELNLCNMLFPLFLFIKYLGSNTRSTLASIFATFSRITSQENIFLSLFFPLSLHNDS